MESLNVCVWITFFCQLLQLIVSEVITEKLTDDPNMIFFVDLASTASRINEAENICISHNGELATVHSMERKTALKLLMKKTNKRGR